MTTSRIAVSVSRHPVPGDERKRLELIEEIERGNSTD